MSGAKRALPGGGRAAGGGPPKQARVPAPAAAAAAGGDDASDDSDSGSAGGGGGGDGSDASGESAFSAPPAPAKALTASIVTYAPSVVRIPLVARFKPVAEMDCKICASVIGRDDARSHAASCGGGGTAVRIMDVWGGNVSGRLILFLPIARVQMHPRAILRGCAERRAR
jgi:hypothetical protein